ncbi:MAG: response regulator transcription factor [Alphaproteobacteria bacterium]|nr:response regulator transcription factor [Alphaproteobacteria bacterium]
MLARKRIARLLSALPDVEIAAECESGEALLEAVADGDVDAVFLDIHMPGLDGTEVAALLGPSGPLVVFLTAHADHAVKAFETGAVDYLLKPTDAARVRTAVDRLRERLAPVDAGPTGRIALPTHNGAVLVDLDALSHAVIDGISVVVHAGGRKHFTDLRLADLERRLPPGAFLRVHRQAIVGTAHVERLENVDTGGYLAHLKDGSVVSVSRSAARQIRRAWGLPR